MSARWRLAMFVIGAVGLAFLFAATFMRLPGPGELRDRYIRAMDARTFAERNITCVVSAINFDYRGIDTLGEEFILFVSVVGSLVLLRQANDKARSLPDRLHGGRDARSSDAVRLATLLALGPTVVFGIYVILHGQLTPGGGFQGGVIVAAALMMIFLCEGLEVFKKAVPQKAVEIAEAVGAAGFVAVGLLALAFGAPYLTNVLPLGKANEWTSGGTIIVISGATGVEVGAGLVLLMDGFLQSLLTEEEEKT